MADNQSGITSTVAPSDSASTSGRKPKPGKAERAARRSAIGSAPGSQADLGKAFVFSSGAQVPKPQPGKYPVVFQTGAGEPARDLTFAISHNVLDASLAHFPARFTYNAKYAEFKAHAEIDDNDFAKELTVSALLRLAQQVVHAHVNLGLPQGDFAPIASTEVRVPASVAAYLSQFGEHAVPALGTRFLLAGYEETVKSLVWMAQRVNASGTSNGVIRRGWLPTGPRDKRTMVIIADRLQTFLRQADLRIDPDALEVAVFSGVVPQPWEEVKTAFGGTTALQDRFDFLFRLYPDVAQFTTAFTTAEATAVLAELNLYWATPSAGHLDWAFNAKEVFTRLADKWARKSATFALFFELSSSQVNRAAATGSQSQMAHVSTTDAVTVVKTHLALSAPDFSLVACFPATAVYTGGLARRVVVTTPLSVTQRATEFVQMDWR